MIGSGVEVSRSGSGDIEERFSNSVQISKKKRGTFEKGYVESLTKNSVYVYGSKKMILRKYCK